jgi:hypothetical protein
MEKVEVVDSGCWMWRSTVKRDGYGQFWYEGKPVKAHHVSYRLHKGPIPTGAWVCHTCDVKTCVNPEHLYVGDARTNARDRDQRQRHIGRRKRADLPLIEATVKEIHRLRAEGLSQIAIGRRVGYAQPTVSKILNGHRQFLDRITL